MLKPYLQTRPARPHPTLPQRATKPRQAFPQYVSAGAGAASAATGGILGTLAGPASERAEPHAATGRGRLDCTSASPDRSSYANLTFMALLFSFRSARRLSACDFSATNSS